MALNSGHCPSCRWQPTTEEMRAGKLCLHPESSQPRFWERHPDSWKHCWKYEEANASCDACGRTRAPTLLVAWDACDNQEAGPHSNPNNVHWICRCCRDGGGVGRCDACDALVPIEDLIHVGPSPAVPEGTICTEC